MGLAADAVTLITKVVTDRAKEEIRIALGGNDEFKKLKQRFLYIQEGFLNDLGNGNKHAEKSQLVNVWLEKVKDVGYSTDDLMDNYAYEMLRRKHDADDKFNCHNEIVRLFWPIVFHFQMAHRVNQIMSELDKLDKEANQIGLKPVDLATKAVDTLSQIRQRPPTHIFIGREDDQNRLLELLRNPTNSQQPHHLPIIAIVGIGGTNHLPFVLQYLNHLSIYLYTILKQVPYCAS
ncbi:putative disease resistance protein RGA3 [Bienertia sinuspersici]